jgi:succinate dehydrogenase / fumarate reductase flavoprotein subunit
LLSIRGKRTVLPFHRELGKIMWDECGMARTEASLKKALKLIPALRDEFWKNVMVTGENADFNQALEHAGRVADYLEFAELLCADALHRKESCGGHFREEYQTEEGEANATTRISPTWPPGNTKGWDVRPNSTKSPWLFETSIFSRGATNESDPARVASEKSV